MSNRINEIIDSVKDILIQNYNPNKILIFGSRAKGSEDIGSDFDFAVETKYKRDEEQLLLVKSQIEKISGLYKVDIVFFNEVDDGFKQIILDTGKVIYEKGS